MPTANVRASRIRADDHSPTTTRDEGTVLNSTKIRALIFFHCALKRVLILTGEVYNLINIGLRDLVGKDATYPDTSAVNVKHNLCRLLAVLVEEALQEGDNEFHRCVVIVQHQDLVHRWLLGLGNGLRDNTGADVAPITI